MFLGQPETSSRQSLMSSDMAVVNDKHSDSMFGAPRTEANHTATIQLTPEQHKMKIDIRNNRFVYNHTDDWHGIKNDTYLYGYSAFFIDDRIYGSDTIVIVGLIANKNKTDPLFCHFAGFTGTIPGDLYTIPSLTFPATCTFVLHCKMPNGITITPKYISISFFADDTLPTVTVPVEIPREKTPGKNNYSLCICLKELYRPTFKKYNDIQVINFIEWVELNRILGIDHISVYIQSTTEVMEEVLSYYASTGYVDLRSKQAEPGRRNTSKKPRRHFGLNDCLYRNIHAFDRLLMIDTDEFIVPQYENTIQDMIHNLEKEAKEELAMIQFRNTVFFTDVDGTAPSENRLITMESLYHLETEKKRFRPKYLFDLKHAITTFTHKVLRYYPEEARKMTVSPSVASSQHYKACETSRQKILFREYKGCSDLAKNMYYDDRILRFRPHLRTAVHMVVDNLKLDIKI